MTEASRWIKSALYELAKKNKDNSLKLCKLIDDLIGAYAEEILTNQTLTFSDKFQIVADMKYASEVLEKLMEDLEKAATDPFYYLVSLVEHEDE